MSGQGVLDVQLIAPELRIEITVFNRGLLTLSIEQTESLLRRLQEALTEAREAKR